MCADPGSALAPSEPPRKRLRSGPTSGPELHAGMFRVQNARRVEGLRDALRALSASAKPPAERLLEALEGLGGCVVDAAVLERTGVQRDVKALRGHPEEEVGRAAGALFAEWLRDVRVRKEAVGGLRDRGGFTERAARTRCCT